MKSLTFKNAALLIATLIICICLNEVKGESCMSKFKNFKEMETVFKTCKDKLGLKDEDIAKNPVEELPKNGYEDKCFLKCLLTDMKYLKSDGTPDVAGAEADLKKNAPADKVDELIKAMKTCIASAAKDPAMDPCKSAAMLKVCFSKEESKIC